MVCWRVNAQKVENKQDLSQVESPVRYEVLRLAALAQDFGCRLRRPQSASS